MPSNSQYNLWSQIKWDAPARYRSSETDTESATELDTTQINADIPMLGSGCEHLQRLEQTPGSSTCL